MLRKLISDPLKSSAAPWAASRPDTQGHKRTCYRSVSEIKT